MAPTTPQKFTFDTEFFEVVGGIPVTTAPAQGAPTPQPRGAEALRQQAYTEGHTVGLAEGQAQAQADLARLQQHLQNTLMALQQGVEEREGKLLASLLGLLQGSLHNILGHAAQHYGAEVLEHHLRALLPLAKTDEALTLRIHPAARGYHEKLGLPQANILGLPLRIATDANLGPVDALIEWQHGGVEARLAEHTQSLQTLLSAAGASPLPTPSFASGIDLTTPVGSATPAATPATAPATAPAPTLPAAAVAAAVTETLLSDAAAARSKRAADLLGDDDLVDALK